jgi:hypothetical protein
MRSFEDIIEALEADELNEKIVSLQSFFAAEDALVNSGKIDLNAGIETGALKLSDEELSAFSRADQDEEDFVWINSDDATDENDDTFLTRDGLVRYLKKAMHDNGQVFVSEINAKLQAFQNCDDVADKVKTYEPVPLPQLEQGNPVTPVRQGTEIPVRHVTSQNPSNRPITLTQFFNIRSRREKIVSFEEFNRIAKELEAQPFTPHPEYDLQGQSAWKTPQEAKMLFEKSLLMNGWINLNSQTSRDVQYFVPALALSYYVSGMSLDAQQSTLMAKCFDQCEDHSSKFDRYLIRHLL